MLTIGRLAAYAGVTVRAVHHYHHTGLLPEPDRDASGYRRYDAAAVATLLRIRALADAGVPLARVGELLEAGPAEFAGAVNDIDRRLRAEIRAKQNHRRRIAQLAAGDNLALPPEAVDYLDHLRKLGFPDQMIDLERNAWILIAAQAPDEMPTLMALKRAQLDDPAVVEFYRDLLDTGNWEPDDPRVPALADRLADFLDRVTGKETQNDYEYLDLANDELVGLLDAFFVDALPIGRRLMELLEKRGWAGWTRLERTDTAPNDHHRPRPIRDARMLRPDNNRANCLQSSTAGRHRKASRIAPNGWAQRASTGSPLRDEVNSSRRLRR